MSEKRRAFIKKISIAAAGLSLSNGFISPLSAKLGDQAERMIGIQMGAHSFYDEGMEYVLDFLRNEAEINTLMFYSHTYYGAESRPLRVMAHDHGKAPRDFENSNLTRVWVKHHDKYFKDTVLRHHQPDSSFEYADKDIFNEIQKPARERGMKIYIRLLEASAGNGKKYVKNYDQVLTETIDGKPGRGPCWNNPDYRNWVWGTARDVFENYDLDGIQYGAERVGPLSDLFLKGNTPTCFCQYCQARNKSKGIDPERAKKGYTKAFQYMQKVAAGQASKVDTVHTNMWRFMQEYPEILAWNFQWFRADEEIQEEMYRKIKQINPNAIVGRHIDHQRSSWDPFYRSAVTYGEMAEYADFIKPILYHDIYGPRLRNWVIDSWQQRMMNDFNEKQTLEIFYNWMGYSKETQIELNDLERVGMGPEYVYDETKRCVEGVNGKSQIIAGIGIDVPWHAPGGMQPNPSDPERLRRSVYKAMEAGANGLLASRDYDEMRHSSLRAFGQAVRRIH